MVTRFKNRFEILVGDTPSDFVRVKEGPVFFGIRNNKLLLLFHYFFIIQNEFLLSSNNRAELPARPLFPLVEERATKPITRQVFGEHFHV